MRVLKFIILSVVVLFVLAHFIPAEKTNPLVTQDIQTPDDVKTILKKACYDCHSNESVWPWYSNIVPVKMMIAKHVVEGRKHLNFSEWDSYNDTKKEHKLEETWEEIEKGAMPLSNYIPLHKEAKLSDEEKEIIKVWTQKEIKELLD